MVSTASTMCSQDDGSLNTALVSRTQEPLNPTEIVSAFVHAPKFKPPPCELEPLNRYCGVPSVPRLAHTDTVNVFWLDAVTERVKESLLPEINRVLDAMVRLYGCADCWNGMSANAA